MRLTDASNKIKSLQAFLANSSDLPKDAFMVLLILLVGGGAFMLGRLSASDSIRKDELSVTNGAFLGAATTRSAPSADPPQHPRNTPNASEDYQGNMAPKGMYVGSKSGKTYHLPWCSGAKRIKKENEVWFDSKADAEGKGYVAAANCHGI